MHECFIDIMDEHQVIEIELPGGDITWATISDKENKFEQEIELVLQSITDAESYIRYANRYLTLLREGKNPKGTKLSGQVKNHRSTALISSLVDVKHSTLG